ERAGENPALHALGMTREQLFGLTLIRSGIVAVAGAGIGIVLAFLVSPMTPFGRLARVSEPAPGFGFDWLVLAGGGIALAALVVALASFPAWRSSRVRENALGLDAPGTARPSRVAGGLARAGGSRAGAAGTRMVLHLGSG